MPFEHLLVPIDFEPASEVAVELAVMLASSYEAKLDLCHAFFIPPFAYESSPMPCYGDILREAQRELDAKLASMLRRYPKTESVLVEGEPRQCIIDAGVERGADLIVMGTHGRRGLAHVFLGSVAERIVRSSPVPVLTTCADHASKSGAVAFRHVLVPTDFGEPSMRSVGTALELAQRFDARLTIVHSSPLAASAAYPPAPEIEHEARTALARALTRARAWVPSAQSVLVHGDPREQILEVARDRGADLIVMGTHARRGVSRALLGSVAERLVQTSPIPVLTVGASARVQSRPSAAERHSGPP